MTWAKDTAERVIVTFLEGWLGAWIGIGAATNASASLDHFLDKGYIAAGVAAAVISFLKALAATRVGDGNDASLVSGG